VANYSPATEENFRKLAGKILRKLKHKNSSVEVFFVSPARIKQIEKHYLGTHTGEVDVLSFPEPAAFPHPEKRGTILGEIYLNRKIAKSDPARARYLLVHAVLHLSGYGHEKKRDRMRMKTREKELCEELFVGNAYFP
jgi:rRNA maturation RNase YbeY